MRVISSIIAGHNLWLVCLAAVVCIAGSTVTVRLLERAMRTEGLQRSGWLFQAASAGGSSVWCTHFVAILAYQPGTPVTFDPILTVASLAIAILGLVLAFAIAAATRGALTAVASGTLAGLTISLMHYVGMAAYHVSGIVASNGAYVAASVVLSVVLSVTALTAIMQTERAYAAPIAMFAFVLAILSQHFTGMAAISIIPLASAATNAAVFEAMAVATAGVALFIVGTGVASQMIDSRARSENNRRLHHMALNDPLTGLPNRTSFSERLDRELARAEKEGHELAVIGIDLNRFKEINDFRGHSAGDQALKIIAGRLTECVEGGEFVARIGGDEFAALKDFRDEDVLLDFLGKLEVALFEPLEIDDFRASAGASIGVAVYPHDGITAETLIGNSDLAMYRAKSELNTAVCFYESRLDEIARERQALARELRRALELQQFDLHFQVQISVTHATICGYEVLLRWYHPERGLIPPLDIGEWVLREACRRAAGWQIPHRIAVNLSPVQFGQPELPRLVHEILMETGLPAARLELEITESTIIADKPRALHILRQIKALGVTVALDDFGTGYSSLDTLRSFPFDKIKLDRLFMNEVETNPQTRAIVRAVLALGKSLDVPILAEGVETDNQLELLRREGCDEAQGFLLGRPGPHEEILQYDDVFTLFETELMAKTAERA
jgi:diguanylate cyclase (GGDEF)-like protein